MKRACRDCPKRTQIVCRHAFGAYWAIKSGGGEGCDHPLDEVTAAWVKSGWRPGGKAVKTITVSVPVAKTQGEFAATRPLSDEDY